MVLPPLFWGHSRSIPQGMIFDVQPNETIPQWIFLFLGLCPLKLENSFLGGGGGGLPLQGAHALHKGGGCAPCAGGGNRAVTNQPRMGQSTSYGYVKSSHGGGGAGGWDRSGCAKGAPRSANRQGEEQHRHTERGSHTRRDKGEQSRQGGGAQQGRRGNQNSGNREPEWRGWQSVRMGGNNNKGDGLAS